MKAVICTKYGPPDVLQLQDVDKPVPGADDLLIRIRATAVTASDCIVRGFQVRPAFWLPMALAIGFRKPRRPILGMVLAGDVEAVGENVTEFKPGAAVFACDFNRFVFGMYAESIAFPQAGMLAAKPANLSYEEAAALPYGGLLGLHFLKKGDIQRRKTVLIYGASGAIGTMAVQLARHYGAEVTGVCSTRNIDLVQSLGAAHVIDYTQQDSLPPGQRYDLVLDAAGKSKRSALKQASRQALTPDGAYVSIDDGTPKPRMDDLLLLKELAEAGAIQPVIDRRYPLDDIVEAHRYAETGRKRGNVVITVAP